MLKTCDTIHYNLDVHIAVLHILFWNAWGGFISYSFLYPQDLLTVWYIKVFNKYFWISEYKCRPGLLLLKTNTKANQYMALNVVSVQWLSGDLECNVRGRCHLGGLSVSTVGLSMVKNAYYKLNTLMEETSLVWLFLSLEKCLRPRVTCTCIFSFVIELKDTIFRL